MTVVVVRLPCGLLIEHPAESGQVIALRAGLNELEADDGAAFAEWLAANGHLPIVKRRDVFVVPPRAADRLGRDGGSNGG